MTSPDYLIQANIPRFAIHQPNLSQKATYIVKWPDKQDKYQDNRLYLKQDEIRPL